MSIDAVPHTCARVDGERADAARGEGHARQEPRSRGERELRKARSEARVLSGARPLEGRKCDLGLRPQPAAGRRKAALFNA